MCWYTEIPVAMDTDGFHGNHKTPAPPIFALILWFGDLEVVFLSWKRMKRIFNWLFVIALDVFSENSPKLSTTDTL